MISLIKCRFSQSAGKSSVSVIVITIKYWSFIHFQFQSPSIIFRPAVPSVDEIKLGSCHQDEVPQTPVTPVSAEGLTSLQNLIKQDAYTLNRTSTQRLERYVQKLANAAQASSAESGLLHDQNQMLIRMNNEAKVG